LDTLALKDESNGSRGFALTVAKRVHQLFQLGRTLDLEEDLVVVVRHLDVEVLGVRSFVRLCSGRAAVFVFGRHIVQVL
jgi:hypothetical protein